MSKSDDGVEIKLLWELLLWIFIALVVAIGCGYGIYRLGNYYVEKTFDNQEFNKSFQQKYMNNLQEFVKHEKINVSNISVLDDWSSENSYVYFSVYFNNKVIYNSDYAYTDDVYVEGDEISDNAELINSDYFYELELYDGTITSVDMFCYDYYGYSNYVLGISVSVGIVIFLIIITRFIGRKVTYIHQLENELRILEAGDLEYPISVKGRDELGGLARGIDQMRLAVMENNLKEQKALQANKNLVTAMSHDLRTPLTTLTGYLELLNMEEDIEEDKFKHYLELSLDKTREIKELSDELFEYFLVYGEEQRKIDVSKVPVHELVSDLIENQFLCLEEEGYVIQADNGLEPDAGDCLVNPQYMKRVLNNILSNLEKYADKEYPITVSAKIEDMLCINVVNRISRSREPHESTKIGLITCERIMKLHGGEFLYKEENGNFDVKITIPMSNQ
ncbi:MAG: HAMP domain-containing histidine kinase [Lachnospiraceae bacterium]|nr:HAMP domain-containing histidine kinase [Lachnospiraceae bacterium]